MSVTALNRNRMKQFEFRNNRAVSDQEKKRFAIYLLCDFTRPLTNRQIAEKVGVTYKTMLQWRRDPRFVAELNISIDQLKTMCRREAFHHFFQRIKMGEYKAIIDYFKMTGDLTNNVKIDATIRDARSEEDIDSEINKLSSELGLDLVETTPED